MDSPLQERRGSRETGRERSFEKRQIESGDSSGYESSIQTNKSEWKRQEPQ